VKAAISTVNMIADAIGVSAQNPPTRIPQRLALPTPFAVVPTLRHQEAVAMGKEGIKPNHRRRLLRLPDMDH